MKTEPIAKSELIINSDGTVFHLHIKPENLADIVFLFGDMGRVDMFAEMLDSVEFTGESREFRTVTGSYNGVRVTGLSTGIGTDNIDIVMNELDALANIDFETRCVKKEHKTLTILRIGTCGCCQPDIPLGSYILSHISIGFDGVLNWYKDFDKVRNKDMEEAFIKYMNWPERFSKPYFVRSSQKILDRFKDWTCKGMTVSAVGFYGPQGRQVRLGLTIPNLIQELESFNYNGFRITNIEMESSAVAGLAQLLGHDAATVCLEIANRHIHESNPDYKPLMVNLLKKSLDALTSR